MQKEANREENFIGDSHEPLNIVAVTPMKSVVLSTMDFHKLFACRDNERLALPSKKDVPHSLVRNVLSSFS